MPMVSFESHVDELPYAHGGTAALGVLREKAEYFKVNEELSFQPSGEGEYVFLRITKTALNTEDVVKILAIHAGVTRRSVSYAGMKDRNAVTTQWFSVQLPGKEGPDWTTLNNETLKIEDITRHSKKLKRGAIKCNKFELVISQLKGDKEQLEQRLESIKAFGVPNYFMEQRFGYLCQNLSRTFDCFSKGELIKNRKMRSLFLSSARSYLFNQVLADRVRENTWDKPLDGDAFILAGTRQYFKEETITNDIQDRVLQHDIHSSGPLFGTGTVIVSDTVESIEANVMLNNKIFCNGLIKHKVESARRSLRSIPANLSFEWLSDDKLQLSFSLQSGSYATAVIRELCDTKTQHAN